MKDIFWLDSDKCLLVGTLIQEMISKITTLATKRKDLKSDFHPTWLRCFASLLKLRGPALAVRSAKQSGKLTKLLL